MRGAPAAHRELALRGPIPFGTIALLGCALVITMTSVPVALIAMLVGLEPGAPHEVSDGVALLGPAMMLWTLLFGMEARRRSRRARLTWDGWGLYEWEGESVRTAIPWSAARAQLRASDEAVEWAHVFDADGRCITVCTRGATPPEWQPARECEAEDLAPLAARLRALPRGRAVPDTRDRVRPDAWWSQLRVSIPCVVLSSLLFVWFPPAWVLSAVLAIAALALSTLPALVELARLVRTEWARRDLRLIWLERVEGLVAVAGDQQGRELRLDARGWVLSDASLGWRRRGVMRARVGPPVAGASPYRGSDARTVELAETPFDRVLRQRRLWRTSLELVLRLVALTVAIRIGWEMVAWLAAHLTM